jgi:hypothetical protein
MFAHGGNYANVRLLYQPAYDSNIFEAAASPGGQFVAFMHDVQHFCGGADVQLDICDVWRSKVLFQSHFVYGDAKLVWAPQPLDNGDWLLIIVRWRGAVSYRVSLTGRVTKTAQPAFFMSTAHVLLMLDWKLRVCRQDSNWRGRGSDDVYTVDRKTGIFGPSYNTIAHHPCVDHLDCYDSWERLRYQPISNGLLLVWHNMYGVFLCYARNPVCKWDYYWAERKHRYFPNVRFRQQIMQLLLVYQRLARKGRAPIPFEVWLYMLRFVPVMYSIGDQPIAHPPGLFNGAPCGRCQFGRH